MQYLISLDRVRAEETTSIEETFSPEFLAVEENDLHFTSPVKVEIELSLSNDFLLVSGNISLEAIIRCKICNELFTLPLFLDFDWTSEEDLTQEIDLFPLLREQILLEIPQFAECKNGACPERSALTTFFAKNPGANSPFSDLKIDC